MNRQPRIPRLTETMLTGMEPGEKRILKEYCRLLRTRKPLSETKKFELAARLSCGCARRRLVYHYLPQVVTQALRSEEPGTLFRRIEAGNKALMDCLRAPLDPLDDMDFAVDQAIQDAIFRELRETVA